MDFHELSTPRSGIAQPGVARLRLREATAPDHAAVDAAYAAFDLSELSGYRGFLDAQLACVRPLEEALTSAGAERLFPDWPSRRRTNAIIADLADLGRGEAFAAPRDFIPTVTREADMLGALYVLEGSRFGGAVLARDLPPQRPRRFLGANADPAVWRRLLAVMDRGLASEPAIQAAAGTARAVFAVFEAAARARLETVVG